MARPVHTNCARGAVHYRPRVRRPNERTAGGRGVRIVEADYPSRGGADRLSGDAPLERHVTFSELTFEVRFGPSVLAGGVLMALVMGALGGLFPSGQCGCAAPTHCGRIEKPRIPADFGHLLTAFASVAMRRCRLRSSPNPRRKGRLAREPRGRARVARRPLRPLDWAG
jgi:hypothetical protein